MSPLEVAVAHVTWAAVGPVELWPLNPLAEFMHEQRDASHLSHRPGAKCSSPVRTPAVCLSTSTARNALGYCRAAPLHHPLSYAGPLLVDRRPVPSALRETNGEDPRITGCGICCYCRGPAGSSQPQRWWGAARLSEASASHPLFWWSKPALHGCIMATLICRVQFLDDTDPFNSTNFPEPTRPPIYTFREDIPLINQIAGVHRLLKAPQKVYIKSFCSQMCCYSYSNEWACLKVSLTPN